MRDAITLTTRGKTRKASQPMTNRGPASQPMTKREPFCCPYTGQQLSSFELKNPHYCCAGDACARPAHHHACIPSGAARRIRHKAALNGGPKKNGGEEVRTSSEKKEMKNKAQRVYRCPMSLEDCPERSCHLHPKPPRQKITYEEIPGSSAKDEKEAFDMLSAIDLSALEFTPGLSPTFGSFPMDYESGVKSYPETMDDKHASPPNSFSTTAAQPDPVDLTPPSAEERKLASVNDQGDTEPPATTTQTSIDGELDCKEYSTSTVAVFVELPESRKEKIKWWRVGRRVKKWSRKVASATPLARTKRVDIVNEGAPHLLPEVEVYSDKDVQDFKWFWQRTGSVEVFNNHISYFYRVYSHVRVCEVYDDITSAVLNNSSFTKTSTALLSDGLLSQVAILRAQKIMSEYPMRDAQIFEDTRCHILNQLLLRGLIESQHTPSCPITPRVTFHKGARTTDLSPRALRSKSSQSKQKSLLPTDITRTSSASLAGCIG